MRSNRDKGKELEEFIAAELLPIYKYSRPTVGSGSTPIEMGDVKNPYFCIEAKYWSTNSFSIKESVWKKIEYEANSESKDAVYVTKNKNNNILVSMGWQDWKSLVFEVLELRNKK